MKWPCSDFRKQLTTLIQTVITGQCPSLQNILVFSLIISDNSSVISEKARRQLHCRGRTGLGCVEKCSSMIESVVNFAIITWFGSLSVGGENRLHIIVPVARMIIGVSLADLPDIFRKKRAVWCNHYRESPPHRLCGEFETSQVG